MTRFWITLPKAVELVVNAFRLMTGGEIFVPKIPSMKMIDFAMAIAPEAEIREVGIRPGEKMHEVMIPEDDARHTREYKDHFRIIPEFMNWEVPKDLNNGGKPLPEGFVYSSDKNDRWLTKEELLSIVKNIKGV